MLKLNSIKRTKGATQTKKRLGRGQGSGWGKQAGKGHKGQHARSGGGVRPAFEGGQTPLFRRLTKRGFKNKFKEHFMILNVRDLERLDPAIFTEISLETLRANNKHKGREKSLAILGTGDIKKAFNIKAHKVTPTAREKIEKAGGKIEILSV